MTKFVVLLVLSLLFLGCTSSSSSNNVDDTDNKEINYSEDTIPNEAIAKVPHNKSSIPMLGILLSYNNQHIDSNDAQWHSKLFGNDPKELNHYYDETSHSNFKFTTATESSGIVNDGIISVLLDKNHPDVSIDYFSTFESSVYPDLKLALETLDDYIDFSNYDNNADGYITPNELILTFIVAGYEDAYEGTHVNNGIWAHQYCADSTQTPILDGVSLMGCAYKGNFAIFGEKHNIQKPHDATIGIIAHELAHAAFSLPDLYNTSSFLGGIGSFGIMGSGIWTNANSNDFYGTTPTHFTAWSKIYAGWVTPVETDGYVSLIETASDDYNILKIPISANHYYLIENRNNSGYDRGLYSLNGTFKGGIAIWHINQNQLTEENFNNNSVNNNTSDKAVDLIEAEDTGIDFGNAGGEKALFYSPHIDFFEENSLKITNITQRGSTMSLNITKGI